MIWGLDRRRRVFQGREIGSYIVTIIIPVITTNNDNYKDDNSTSVAGAILGTSHYSATFDLS